MKRTYELMLVVKADFPADDEKKRNDLVTKLVKGAHILDLTVLGKKHLAYPIKKQTEGVYVLATVCGDSLQQSAIENEVKMQSNVLRFLLLEREG